MCKSPESDKLKKAWEEYKSKNKNNEDNQDERYKKLMAMSEALIRLESE